ncbi:MAG: sigma-70 family RNA polymerase sigma factor [Phycisphaeraceae bacterium]|nr:sigma-70 family RNA polymerase sigma factor [Phycisphaeraceae bacterium]
MGGMEAMELRQFLSGLDLTSRRILVLTYTEGLNETEIGLVLDMPAQRVRESLNRLRHQAKQAVSFSFGAHASVSGGMVAV